MKTFACTTVFALLVVVNTSAAEIMLRLGGSAFEGGPSYAVLIGTRTIGSGTLDTIPVDGALVVIDVDDALLRTTDPLTVRLTNDRFADGKGDRNLQVISAEVAGVPLNVGDFVVMREGAPIGDGRPPGTIFANLDAAVAEAPADGWLPALVAAAPSGDDRQTMATTVEPQIESRPAPVPARKASPCDASATITEFVHGATTLGAGERTKLQTVINQAASGECSVEVLGYASTSGATAINEALSAARAEVVMAALSAEASFTASTVEGRGETTQFGDDPAANRRVTVQLSK